MFYLFSALIILVVFFLITVDLLFVPTIILTLVSLFGFIGYLTYVYSEWSLNHALLVLAIFLGLGIFYGIIIFKFKLWRGFSLEEKLPDQKKEFDVEAVSLVGKSGITLTDLKPIGLVRLNNAKMDAIAINGFIPEGSEVTVTGRSGPQLKVKLK